MKVASRLTALVIAALALAIAPGLASAKSNHGLKCGRGHRGPTKAIGKKCSRSGKHHASGVSGTTQATRPSTAGNGASSNSNNASTSSPSTQCATEQSSNSAQFKASYGSGTDAFGKCVSDHTRGDQHNDATGH